MTKNSISTNIIQMLSDIHEKMNTNHIEVVQRITTLETTLLSIPPQCKEHREKIAVLEAEQNKAFGRRSILQIITGSSLVLAARELISLFHK